MTTTYSFWTLFRNCRMACYWRYIRELVPVDRDGHLAFGSVIHKCLQIWHGTRKLESVLDFIDRTYIGRPQEEDQKRAWHLATALMKAYPAQYSMEDFEVVALERKFEGKIANPKTGKSSRSLDIAGKIDGIVKVGPGFFLLEHKSASQIDSGYLEKLWTDFQVVLYSFWGIYTVYLILRNPDDLAATENHPSWTHMYLMMMAAQIGFAVAYLV